MCHRSVGLIQNLFEGLGMTTVSLTVHPHISFGVGVPRALYVRFPQGNLFGNAGDAKQQCDILTATLQVATVASEAGTVLEFPARWRMSTS